MALTDPLEQGGVVAWLALAKTVLANPHSWPYLLLAGLMLSQHLLFLAFLAKLDALGVRIDALVQAIHELPVQLR